MSNTRTLPVNIYFNDTLVNSTRTLQVNIYFNDTLVNSTHTLPVNIFTCAWKTEKPCKLQ